MALPFRAVGRMLRQRKSFVLASLCASVLMWAFLQFRDSLSVSVVVRFGREAHMLERSRAMDVVLSQHQFIHGVAPSSFLAVEYDIGLLSELVSFLSVTFKILT